MHLLAVVICPIQKGKFGVEVPFFYNSNRHFNAFEQFTKFAVFSLLAKDACCEDPVFACGLEDAIDAVSEVQEDDEDDDSSKGSTEGNVSSLSETPIASLKLKKPLARRHGQMKRKQLKISRRGRPPKKTRHESDDSSFKASSSDEEEEEFAAERVKTPKHVNTSSAGRTLRPSGGSQRRGRPRKLVLERPGRKKRTRRSAGAFTAATRQHQFDNTDDEDGEGNGDPVVESSDEEVSAEVVWNTRDAENLPPSNANPRFEPTRCGNVNDKRQKWNNLFGHMTEAELLFYCWYPILKVVWEHTTVCQHESFPDDTPVTFNSLVIHYALKLAMTVFRLPAKEDYWKSYTVGPFRYPDYGRYQSLAEYEYIESVLRFSKYTVQRACGPDDLWKVRDSFDALQTMLRKTGGRAVGAVVVDEIRWFFSGRGPSLKIMTSKPIDHGWTLWAACCEETGAFINLYTWDKMISKDSCKHLKWGMKGEVLLRFVRHHSPPGSTQPYRGHHWVADNWFSNLSVMQELERLGQGGTFTWVKNGGAPPEVLFGKSKKPTRQWPKGSLKCITLAGNPNIIGWGYMDSGRVALLDNQYGGALENIHRKNKGGDTSDNMGPKALNEFNAKMGRIDDIDNVRASKHGRYSMELFGRDRKWTRRFADGIFDTASAQAFKIYDNIKKLNNVKERRSHNTFITLAVAGLLEGKFSCAEVAAEKAVTRSSADSVERTSICSMDSSVASSITAHSKKSTPSDILQDNQHMHWSGKKSFLMKNDKRTSVEAQLKAASTTLEEMKLKNKLKNTSKFVRRMCIQCRDQKRKVVSGCSTCNIHLHLEGPCYEQWHKRLALGQAQLNRNKFRATTSTPEKPRPASAHRYTP